MQPRMCQLLSQLLAFIRESAKNFFNRVLSMDRLFQDNLMLKFDFDSPAFDFALAGEALVIEFPKEIGFSLVEFR